VRREASDPTEADAAALARQLAEVAASERELRALLTQANEQIAERDRVLDEMTKEQRRLLAEAESAHRELRTLKRTRVFRLGFGWWRLRDRLRGRSRGG
jgi:septal ring factor EnvC (AmiA/AmiB activator)